MAYGETRGNHMEQQKQGNNTSSMLAGKGSVFSCSDTATDLNRQLSMQKQMSVSQKFVLSTGFSEVLSLYFNLKPSCPL